MIAFPHNWKLENDDKKRPSSIVIVSSSEQNGVTTIIPLFSESWLEKKINHGDAEQSMKSQSILHDIKDAIMQKLQKLLGR